MKLLNHTVSSEIVYSLSIIFLLVLSCLTIFYFRYKKQPTAFREELFLRTRTWFFIALTLTALVFTSPIIRTVLLAFCSFMAFREMISISGFRAADRVGLFVGFCAIPVQYFLAYNNFNTAFLVFIPIVMFSIIPFVLISKGDTQSIGRSMAMIPAVLMMTVFMMSHLVMLHHVEIPFVEVEFGSLLLFLFVLTALNDVFQFVWGKAFGKHKISPKISPNKTWEGFIGGVLSTATLGFCLQFLMPFSGMITFFIGLIIGIVGFGGDILISAIKRDLKLKDTSDFLPGHGGLMDRLDSLILTAPVFYYLLIGISSLKEFLFKSVSFASF